MILSLSLMAGLLSRDVGVLLDQSVFCFFGTKPIVLVSFLV